MAGGHGAFTGGVVAPGSRHGRWTPAPRRCRDI